MTKFPSNRRPSGQIEKDEGKMVASQVKVRCERVDNVDIERVLDTTAKEMNAQRQEGDLDMELKEALLSTEEINIALSTVREPPS